MSPPPPTKKHYLLLFQPADLKRVRRLVPLPLAPPTLHTAPPAQDILYTHNPVDWCPSDNSTHFLFLDPKLKRLHFVLFFYWVLQTDLQSARESDRDWFKHFFFLFKFLFYLYHFCFLKKKRHLYLPYQPTWLLQYNTMPSVHDVPETSGWKLPSLKSGLSLMGPTHVLNVNR